MKRVLLDQQSFNDFAVDIPHFLAVEERLGNVWLYGGSDSLMAGWTGQGKNVMHEKLEGDIWYPEDIKVGSSYFGSPVAKVEDYIVEGTYLCKYKFILEDGTARELFSDQELE